MSVRGFVAIGLAQVALLGWASAQPLVETLYLEGQPLPGADALPGYSFFDLVRSNGQLDLMAAPNGSFVGAVRTNPFEGSANSAAGVYYLFGSTDRGRNPTALRREATIASIEQQSLTRPTIDNAGGVAYRALTGNTGLAGSGESGLWEGDTVVAYPGDPIPAGPLAGSFFTSLTSPRRTPEGVTLFSASYSDTQGGASVGSALLRGTDAFDVLLASGDTIDGLGVVPSVGGAISNARWSIAGGSYIADVLLTSDGLDAAPVVNGQALLTTSGRLIADGEDIAEEDGGLLLPTEEGGTRPETWSGFGVADVNEAGDWVFSAFTDAVGGPRNVLVANGVLLHREGDIVDGVQLDGQVQGVGVNDLGDLAFAWNDTLFVNGKKVAGVGTLVDTDGDGVADAPIDGTGLSLDRLEITNLPALGGGAPVVYFGGEASGGLDTFFRTVPADTSGGDYNGDGLVNAADYTVWRDTLASQLLLAADGDEDNAVDPDDYVVWQTGYGGADAQSAAAPEPGAAALVWVAAGGVAAGRRGVRRPAPGPRSLRRLPRTGRG
ncbi:hypothetical protein [Botrimarina sp.]|uniref:hypothetical protein n=1 Tax=Botrimarina sp. TaxID=2795802 RepID=UPI0032EE76A4